MPGDRMAPWMRLVLWACFIVFVAPVLIGLVGFTLFWLGALVVASLVASKVLR